VYAGQAPVDGTRAIVSQFVAGTPVTLAGIDLALAAVVIEALLESLSHRVMLAGKAPEHGDALAQEATRMIVRYLGG